MGVTYTLIMLNLRMFLGSIQVSYLEKKNLSSSEMNERSRQEARGECGWEREGMGGNRAMEGVEHTGAMTHIWEPQD